jgi:hypothetical protein
LDTRALCVGFEANDFLKSDLASNRSTGNSSSGPTQK